MQEKKLTIALAESITCGMASEKLAIGFGTSDVFKGSVVCYTPEVKNTLLKIPKNITDKYTCESMEVTKQMAKNLARLIKADVYAAITGLASPGGSETKAKPVGTVFICVKYKQTFFKKKYLFRGTPIQVRKKASMAVYDLITEKILK